MPIDTQAGLSPVRTVLDNGMVVVARETRKTPAVTISLAVRAGSLCDPAEQPGAMYLLSRVIDRGTAARSAEVIAEELDSRGTSLNITVTRHLFSLVCTCLAEDFRSVLGLLADIVTAPSVPDSELATRKGEVVTALRQDQDNPAVQAVETLMSLLYGAEHPYGRKLKGTLPSVETLTREQLLALHRARFAPALTSAVIVGDVPAAEATDVTARLFDSWHVSAPPALPLAATMAAATRRRVVLPMMNKAQTDIAYGFVTIPRSDPAYFAYWVMNNALGQYALGGRLGDSIRERQGMAYYVSSSFDPNVVAGPLTIRAGVSAANVERAIASIDEELTALTTDGLSEKELTDSVRYMIGSLPRALETNAGIAQFLQTGEFFGLGLDYDQRLPALLRGVTLDQANEAARRSLQPDHATVVVAGPYQGS